MKKTKTYYPSKTMDNVQIQLFGRTVEFLAANRTRSIGTAGWQRAVFVVIGAEKIVTFVRPALASFGSDPVRPVDSNAVERLCCRRSTKTKRNSQPVNIIKSHFKPKP